MECRNAQSYTDSLTNPPCRFRETNIDDVVQVNNVFINVSKGEVARAEDLKKAFGGKVTTEAIVREVSTSSLCICCTAT